MRLENIIFDAMKVSLQPKQMDSYVGGPVDGFGKPLDPDKFGVVVIDLAFDVQPDPPAAKNAGR